ncbi:hypothetical protein ACPOL_7043 (plasmid) [Acidisarcina polymorpha]|uniref:Uncharacterized protein n=1 Tax=Acidisarcina polymorpha TaxID=2211140 RepID=A0A2Z5GAL4_9BACT|nr:hypothetical protein ACPOL_7043 [Acidisarcina polymorpha]
MFHAHLFVNTVDYSEHTIDHFAPKPYVRSEYLQQSRRNS